MIRVNDARPVWRTAETSTSPRSAPQARVSQAKPSKLSQMLRAAGRLTRGAALTGVFVATIVGAGCSSSTPDAPASQPAAVQVMAAQQRFANERFTDTHRVAIAESIAKTAGVEGGHLWRDLPAYAASGRVNAYIEIPRGESTKYEFDLATNERVVDRMLHPSLGGYPTNYGFVPQTMGFDGDPYDVLVLGPPLEGGKMVEGVIVGMMHMDDEKGADPKVVISPVGDDGAPLYTLDASEEARIGTWFDGYKKPDAAKGKWSKVTGWTDADAAKRSLDDVVEFYRMERAQ